MDGGHRGWQQKDFLRSCYFLVVDFFFFFFFFCPKITEHTHERGKKKNRAAGRSHLQLGSSASPGRPPFPPLRTPRLDDPSPSLPPSLPSSSPYLSPPRPTPTPERYSASRALLFSPRTHPSLHLSSLRRAAGSMAKRIIQQQSTSLPSASLSFRTPPCRRVLRGGAGGVRRGGEWWGAY